MCPHSGLERLTLTRLRLIAPAVLAVSASLAHAAAALPLFLAPPQAPLDSFIPTDPAATSSPVVRLNPDALRPGRAGLRGAGARLALIVSPHLADTLVVEEVEVRDAEAFTCLGHLADQPDSSVLLAVVQDAMSGTITIQGRPALQIEALGAGLHRVNVVPAPPADWCAPASLVAEDAPSADAATDDRLSEPVTDQGRRDGPALAEAAADEAPVIDFLVLYTPRALEAAGGEAGMHALLDYAVAENNLCYANSGINARWNIAGRERIAYTDSGSIAVDLLWLMDNPTVASLKTAYRADLVMLVAEYDRFGYAGIATSNGGGHGYTVFLRNWIASGLYVVPHEVGHLLGAGHDRFTCTQREARAGCGAYYSAFSYGHRFELDGVQYRTVMAYEPGITTPYFSGPSVRFRGQVPTGVAEGSAVAADNVRTINLRARIIARTLEAWCRFGFATDAVEVSESAGAATLTVTRTGDLRQSASVECVTVADTAAAGEDFLAVSQRLAFGPGTAEASLTIPVLRGAEGAPGAEGDEEFQVLLRDPDLGTGLDRPTRARVTIRDVDPWFRLGAPHLSVPESVPSVSVRVQRGGNLTAPAQVEFTIRSETAESGLDYDAIAGTLRFAPGETDAAIPVSVLPDTLAESDELLAVELANPNLGGIVPGERTTVVTILDDDREGSLDPTLAVAAPLRPPTSLGGLVEMPDGRMLVSGAPAWRDSPALVLRRQLADGTTDPSFREVEFLPAPGTDPGAIAPVGLGITRQTDGRILAVGEFATVHGRLRPNFVRLHPDGTLDESFAARPDGPCYQTCVQADGRIVVGGSFQRLNGAEQGYLARLYPEGTLDPSFAPRPNGDSIRVRGLALQTDGKVLVCGTFWGFEGLTRPYFARLNTNGTLDRVFAARADGIVNAMSVLPDQRILIAGGFTSPRTGVARLRPDGATDPAFDPGTLFNAPVRQLAPLADGRLLVAGGFTAAGPGNQQYLIRLQANGTPDPTFDTGTGPDDIVSNVALQPDGAVLVSGFFSSINGRPSPYLARLRGVDLRLRFGPSRGLADGRVRLRLEGFPGAGYTVETSTDLAHWEVIRNGTLAAAGAEWDEAPSPGTVRAAYFRARSVP